MSRELQKESMDINLYPVSAHDSGEGHPYAPEDWPNPGDKWGWKVGKRIASEGYFLDRYIYLPSSLRQPGPKNIFASRLSLERYVREKFPDTDIDAFFSSFSWKIPSKAFKKDYKEIFRPFGKTAEDSGSFVEIDGPNCKAGNRFCSSLTAGDNSFSEVMFCDGCCSEPDFCRECCCVVCGRIIDKAGYNYITCEASVQGSICGHASHMDCALRASMVVTVGGNTEYHCRRCNSRADIGKKSLEAAKGKKGKAILKGSSPLKLLENASQLPPRPASRDDIDVEEVSAQEAPPLKRKKATFVSQPTAPSLSAEELLLTDKNHELGRDFMLATSRAQDRKVMDELTSSTLVSRWSSHMAQGLVYSGEILAQLEEGKERITQLSQQNSELSQKNVELQDNLEKASEALSQVRREKESLLTLTRGLEDQLTCMQQGVAAEAARAPEKGFKEGQDSFFDVFPTTDRGKAFLEAWFEERIPAFLKSDRFRQATAMKALRYYRHGVKYACNELIKHGCIKEGMEHLSFLNIDGGLDCLPPESDTEEEPPLPPAAEEGPREKSSLAKEF